MTLYLTGTLGGLNLHPQYFQSFPQTPWRFAESKLQHSTGPYVPGYIWTGVGAGIMLLLTYAQRFFSLVASASPRIPRARRMDYEAVMVFVLPRLAGEDSRPSLRRQQNISES